LSALPAALTASSQFASTNSLRLRISGARRRSGLIEKWWPKRVLSEIQISLTASFWRGRMRLITLTPPESRSSRVLATMFSPTGPWGEMLGTSCSSQGRAPKRKSTVVRAPTGQMSVVLPLKYVSNGGSLTVMISRWRPRS